MSHIAMPVAEAVDSIRSSHFAPTMFSRCPGVPKSLSEGAISGPDKLQKAVPPPRGTEKGAIPYTSIGAKFHRKPFCYNSFGMPEGLIREFLV
jgi:hypothetical protein